MGVLVQVLLEGDTKTVANVQEICWEKHCVGWRREQEKAERGFKSRCRSDSYERKEEG